ncbi:MAG: oxidative damage protection protein [Xanthomonadales bacterium]|jgi:Fe-S cluster biosynthesis and repair protein YggX|nr:oxidative damage protection protein [Xanthomonadales bacterium]
MSTTVHCKKLGIEAPALPRAPYPGAIGQRILAEISQPAWAEWLKHQTLVINENRLNPLDPAARKRLEAEMLRYLFEGGVEKPAGYVPPES